MIELKSGTRIWIAAGFTDLRRGFQGLSSIVETVLEQAPFSGHVFVFRGKRGDLIKLLWFDGDGLCLFQKRFERGRFIWPQGFQCSAGGSLLISVAALPAVPPTLAGPTTAAGSEDLGSVPKPV